MNTVFLDGPAEGVKLLLSRSPVLLRVVQEPGGSWDALDGLEDEAREGERILVYRRVRLLGNGHVSMCDQRGRRCGRIFSAAEYRHWPRKPEISDKTLRVTIEWQRWCNSNVIELDAELARLAQSDPEAQS